MSSLLFFFLCVNFYYLQAQIYECPDYKSLNKPRLKLNKKSEIKKSFKCNSFLINPKKVINPYRQDIQNYVQSRPFNSICLKCSMCLAIAKEMDKIFKETSKTNQEQKQEEVVNLLKANIKYLCEGGFENYDLRKFKQFQVVTDDFSCSTHVRTKMDGRWTEKLREMCATYVNSMDYQSLLNDYLKGSEDISNYLCMSSGIFRDCTSLNFKNTSINTEGNHDSCVLNEK